MAGSPRLIFAAGEGEAIGSARASTWASFALRYIIDCTSRAELDTMNTQHKLDCLLVTYPIEKIHQDVFEKLRANFKVR